ncbi:MAG: hypothetical protein JETT_0812 [Candidatus Jettenia ecosi]|uniref:Uncharacterized protein n=1 Tax=Candidatus Jettenia ecosi TaxID=2494326 RepID=A0A533QE43_9BACT|nr:MAG: hypothetical protein JETT_0812 [Candidatus Jettenia ecosi]
MESLKYYSKLFCQKSLNINTWFFALCIFKRPDQHTLLLQHMPFGF